MTYSCEMIRDLLPLYLDEVCSEDSRRAVEEHLKQCSACRNCLESMKEPEGLVQKPKDNQQDKKLANSLKGVKTKINRKIRNVIIGSAAAVTAVAVGFVLLFQVPIRTIDLDDIRVSVDSYPLRAISTRIEGGAGTAAEGSGAAGDTALSEDAVRISRDRTDTSQEQYQVKVPDMPEAEIVVSGDVIATCEAISVISWSSPYFMREIRFVDIEQEEENTLYIEAFKTTLLNNKAAVNLQTTMSMEFREIDRVVFVEKNGDETVLWSEMESGAR